MVLRLHGASPVTIERLLSVDQPAAIFGGYEERKLDESLFAFAEKHGYERFNADWLGAGVLYVRRPTS